MATEINLGRVRGESAYELAVAAGFVGTQEEWLGSLKGTKGEPGRDGKDGKPGKDGADGFSPTITIATQTPTEYVLEITDVNGSYQTPNLQGQDGSRESGGITEAPVDNKQYARRNAEWSEVDPARQFNPRGEFVLGNMYNTNDLVYHEGAEWIATQDGLVLPPPSPGWDMFVDRGQPGLSAYELAVEQGFGGTIEEWLESLRGQPGAQGPPGGEWGNITGDITKQADLMAALAAKQDADLPWCSGYFQNRSLIANTPVYLTPIFEKNNFEAFYIKDTTIAVKEAGNYMLNFTGGAVSSTSMLLVSILKARTSGDLVWSCRDVSAGTSFFPVTTWAEYLEVGEGFVISLLSSAAQSTISNERSPGFRLMRL